MITSIRNLKKFLIEKGISEDELAPYINSVLNDVKAKKYGLVWEERSENEYMKLEKNFPLLLEKEDKAITFDHVTDTNILIEGDNGHALKILQYTHKELIDVIYIDPPYNTGKDFNFNDKLVSKEDDWRHSAWLSFMNKRLRLAYDLLKPEGAIFISIDENEYAQLKLLCDEVFGEKNFMECIVWNKRIPKNDKGIGNIHEYILLYVKGQPINKEANQKFMMPKDGLDEIYDFVADMKRRNIPIPEAEKELKKFYDKKGYDRGITLYNQLDDNYEIWGKINMCWPNATTSGPRYNVLHPSLKVPVKVPSRGWRWAEKTLFDVAGYNEELGEYMDISVRHDGSFVCKGKNKQEGLWFAKNEKTQASSIRYLKDVARMLFRSIYSTKSDGGMALENIMGEMNTFDYPKPPKLIYDLLDSCTYDKKDAIILDFFAGSGTTGQAVLELNKDDGGHRKFILITNNELSKKDRDSLKKAGVLENSEEWLANGICRKTTYQRLNNVIKGIEIDERIIEGIPSNLKYFTVELEPEHIIEQENIDNLMNKCTNIIELKEDIYYKEIESPEYDLLIGKGKAVIVYKNSLALDYEVEAIVNSVFTEKYSHMKKIVYTTKSDASIKGVTIKSYPKEIIYQLKRK